LAHDLTPHLLKEEMVLFPYIKTLESSGTDSSEVPVPPFGAVSNPIMMMKREHELAGDLLARLNGLTGGYAVPEDACPSYLSFFKGLQGLEGDLHEHIHIENNVLFPQAELAESRVRQR
jgi:regulator of cell morphogenesis and NO signaling